MSFFLVNYCYLSQYFFLVNYFQPVLIFFPSEFLSVCLKSFFPSELLTVCLRLVFLVTYCQSVSSFFFQWIFVSLSEVFFSDLELCRYDSESGSAKLLNTDAIWIRIPITDYNRILDFLSPKKAPLRNAVKNHASIVLFSPSSCDTVFHPSNMRHSCMICIC